MVAKEYVRYIPTKKNNKMDDQKILFVHSEWVGKWFWEKHFMPYFASQGSFLNHLFFINSFL